MSTFTRTTLLSLGALLVAAPAYAATTPGAAPATVSEREAVDSCLKTADSGPSVEQWGKTFNECLLTKGYRFESVAAKHHHKKESAAKENKAAEPATGEPKTGN